MDNILVIGGGSWGTSFANYLASQGNEVKLWIREKEVIESIEKFRENSLFLPEVILSKNLYPVSGLEDEVEKADIIIFAVPSKFIRKSFESLKEKLSGKIIISLSKGFESTSLKTISRIASDVLGKEILKNWITISGPSFAKELSRNFPTAIVAASENPDILKKIQERFSSSILRIYRS
ncbi:MAG: NAD(P)-binding domain-containing protein, partial [Candidatus Aminicenantes bacterium]|nr:NAD(P)-binding domain-containing protein [Candidatus Aminicenantes bacterium]